MKCEKCGGRGFIEYEHGLIMVGCEECEGTGEIDDSVSGTEPDNQPIGGADTSQPKQPRKYKAKRKTSKGTG